MVKIGHMQMLSKAILLQNMSRSGQKAAHQAVAAELLLPRF